MRLFSFYSYKGGSGRTTVLLNTVRHLVKKIDASPERPILLVDADLESAGMTFFFNRNNPMRFSGNLSAYALFNDHNLLSDKISRNTIFKGELSGSTKVCSKSEFVDEIETFDSRSNGINFLYESVKNVSLPVEYMNLFGKILRDSNTNSDSPWTRVIRDLARKLRDEESADDRRKSEMIISYLPVVSFTDVSEFFCDRAELPKGTVKFLGTDLSSESHVSRLQGESRILNFVEYCTKYGYSAAIFDCGSGTQSSADIMHRISDVIVYCLRPTVQFILGTRKNLENYRADLEANLDEESGMKRVILLPNAVPDIKQDDPEYVFCRDAFKDINNIAEDFSQIVDGEFCSENTCMHEVPIFKWREMILGCKVPSLNVSLFTDTREVVEKYTNPDEPSIQCFCRTYETLADSLLRNSEDDSYEEDDTEE